MKNFFKKFYLGIILVFLYVPIVVLICQSFNAGKSRAKWEGFSFRWYGELFQNASIMNALWVTVSIAVIATVIATVLGTLAAIGIYSMKKRPQAIMMTHHQFAQHHAGHRDRYLPDAAVHLRQGRPRAISPWCWPTSPSTCPMWCCPSCRSLSR